MFLQNFNKLLFTFLLLSIFIGSASADIMRMPESFGPIPQNFGFAVMMRGSGEQVSMNFENGGLSLGSKSSAGSIERNIFSVKSQNKYLIDSFCVSGLTCPNLTVIDAVKDGNDIYHLRTDGQIIKNGTEVIVTLPNVESIAKTSSWFLLRSDGAVIKTANLADKSSYVLMGQRIETAEKLIMGQGPEVYNK